jgi:hypothetical protein
MFRRRSGWGLRESLNRTRPHCLYLAVVLDLFSRWVNEIPCISRVSSGVVHNKTMIELCNVSSTFMGT